jgi:hypothetical protein
VASAVVTTIAYRRLMRALEDAVVLILESGWVQSFNCSDREVTISSQRVPSAEALVVCTRIIATARSLHGRWLERKLGEYVVRGAVDGLRMRDVL